MTRWPAAWCVSGGFELQQLSTQALHALAEGRTPAGLAVRAENEALPPRFVAERSLGRIAAGQSALWCRPSLMLRRADGRIVGGCGFKREPRDGRVDIGYDVAPTCRRQGAASAAVRVLLTMSFNAGVHEVMAEVVPDNTGSAAVLRKLGFLRTGPRPDETQEEVDEWLATNSDLLAASDVVD